MTLTAYWLDGKRSPSSHGILNKGPTISTDYKERTAKLYDHYYPIEISKAIPLDEKVKAMEEWWSKAHEIVLETKIKRSDIELAVKHTPAHFRNGLDSILMYCRDKNIPLLIFSAGLGDVIEEILGQANLWFENMKMISNLMIFNDEGHCIGFQDPLIHVFNKNEASVIKMCGIETRSNVILLGDSIGDLQMSKGMKHDVELTVGFLNHNKEELLESYLASFDIVILNDAAIDIVSEILVFIQG